MAYCECGKNYDGPVNAGGCPQCRDIYKMTKDLIKGEKKQKKMTAQTLERHRQSVRIGK